MIFIIVFFSVVSKNLGEGGGEGFRGRETSLQGPRKAFILFKKGNPRCTVMAFNRKITDLEYYIGHQESENSLSANFKTAKSGISANFKTAKSGISGNYSCGLLIANCAGKKCTAPCLQGVSKVFVLIVRARSNVKVPHLALQGVSMEFVLSGKERRVSPPR